MSFRVVVCARAKPRLLPISQRTPTRYIAGLMLPLLRDTTPRGAYTKVQRGPPGKPWFATRDPTTGAEAPTRKARPVEPPPNQESRTAQTLTSVLRYASLYLPSKCGLLLHRQLCNRRCRCAETVTGGWPTERVGAGSKDFRGCGLRRPLSSVDCRPACRD